MAEQLPFKYVGGDPAIDLVNTIDWTSRGPESERLSDYERIARWAEGADVIPPRLGASLRRRAQAQPREAEAAHRAVLRARQVLQRLFSEIAKGETSSGAVEDFNRLLGPAVDHLRVVGSGKSRLQLGWDDQDRPLTSLLWPVLWSAAKLVTSDEASRIRICGSRDCGWMFVDRSRNGLRRWCQMEVCGTMEKTRRRRKGAYESS
jgi:predicted RNA-binding Zn ribbon-like protein